MSEAGEAPVLVYNVCESVLEASKIKGKPGEDIQPPLHRELRRALQEPGSLRLALALTQNFTALFTFGENYKSSQPREHMRRMEAISFGKASVTGALNINQTALLLAYIGILIEHHAGDVANEPLMRAVVVDLACSSPPPLPAIACPVAAQLASKSLTLRNAAYEKALQTHSSEAAAVLAKIAPQSLVLDVIHQHYDKQPVASHALLLRMQEAGADSRALSSHIIFSALLANLRNPPSKDDVIVVQSALTVVTDALPAMGRQGGIKDCTPLLQAMLRVCTCTILHTSRSRASTGRASNRSTDFLAVEDTLRPRSRSMVSGGQLPSAATLKPPESPILRARAGSGGSGRARASSTGAADSDAGTGLKIDEDLEPIARAGNKLFLYLYGLYPGPLLTFLRDLKGDDLLLRDHMLGLFQNVRLHPHLALSASAASERWKNLSALELAAELQKLEVPRERTDSLRGSLTEADRMSPTRVQNDLLRLEREVRRLSDDTSATVENRNAAALMPEILLLHERLHRSTQAQALVQARREISHLQQELEAAKISNDPVLHVPAVSVEKWEEFKQHTLNERKLLLDKITELEEENIRYRRDMMQQRQRTISITTDDSRAQLETARVEIRNLKAELEKTRKKSGEEMSAQAVSSLIAGIQELDDLQPTVESFNTYRAHAELVRSQLQKQIDVVVKDLALEQHRTKLLLADVERLQQERKTMSEEIAHKVEALERLDGMFSRARTEAQRREQTLNNRCILLQRSIAQLERDLLEVTFQLEDARVANKTSQVTATNLSEAQPMAAQ